MMPELFEDDLPYVVPMNRDYDLGYVDGQSQPVADGAGGTNMLPVNWSVDDELIETAIHFPFPFHGTWTLIIPPDLRVWNSATRERVVSGTAYEFSSTLWCMSVGLRIEGVAPSATPDNFLIVSAQFTDAQGASLGTPITDRTKYEVVSIDLEIAGISELDEETQPAFVPLNDDYDENNKYPNAKQEPVTDNGRLHEQLVSDAPGIVSDDDDLVHAKLTIDGPSGQVGLYWIEVLNEPSWLSYPDWPGNAQFIRVWLLDGTEVPRDEYSALPIVLDDELDLLIEGLALSQCELALKAHFIPAGDYAAAGVFPVVTDEAEAIPVKIDLDIDSDNNDGYDPPARTAYEDENEEKTADSYPGKFIAVNDNDNDGDGIPDFADGFNQFGGTSNQTVGEDFVPLVIELPSPIDLSQASLRIWYNASDPKNVDRTGSGTEADPYIYTTDGGNLRIWTKEGSAARNKNDVSDAENPGDFVYPETYDDLSKLGFVGATRTVTLYVEGINASTSVGHNTIKVEVDPDGEGPQGFSLVDVVRTTVVGLNMTVYNGGSDLDNGEALGEDGSMVAESREETEGAYLLVNWDDDDSDGQMNADGTFSQLPVPDLYETCVKNEDNMAKITFEINPILIVLQNHGVVELEVTSGAGKIKLWKYKTKVEEVGLVGAIKTWDLSKQSQREEYFKLGEDGIWIEGIDSSTAERDVTLVLRYKYNNQEIAADTVKATVVMINLGNAVYRYGGGVAAGRGHAALVTSFLGPCTRDNLMNDARFQITEMPGYGHGPERNLLTNITAAPGLDAWGCYTNTADISYVARLSILCWAAGIMNRAADIGYCHEDAMEPEEWDDHLNTIENLRCDGLVEVCYEANGINVWGRIIGGSAPRYDIRNDDFQEDHGDFGNLWWANTLVPATQCGHVAPVDAVTTFVRQNLCTPIGSRGGNP